MSEKQEELVSVKKNWLPVILCSIFGAVLIFICGYTLGINYGKKTASAEWATEFLEGTYAGDDSYTGTENMEARKDVEAIARASGRVSKFSVEYVHPGLIVSNAERNGVLYRDSVTLQGGRLQAFSSERSAKAQASNQVD